MTAAFLASCMSPTDLMSAVSLAPPSEAIADVLDAVHAAPPTKEQLARWRRLCPNVPWPNRRARRVVACIGRRGLKTSGLGVWTLLFELLCGGHEAFAAPGSRIYFVVVAPRQGQAREAVRAIKAGLDALSALGVKYDVRDLSGVPEIVLRAPASNVEKVVTVMTADAVSVRGFAVAFAWIDEAGFLDSAEWHAMTDRDVLRALVPGMAQFPNARVLFTSSPGAPQGLFHELVTKPPRDALVVRAPTWITNPRISEKRCRELAADDGEFEQEYAARRFGYSNENFIDSSAVRACLGSPYADKGPRQGRFIIGLDVGQLRDATGIVVMSSFEEVITPTSMPVRHVVVEHAEKIASSRKDPTPIDAIAERVAALSRLFNWAPIVFDPFSAPTLKAELSKRGFSEAQDEGELLSAPRRFMQQSMAPQHQTPRWRLLRDLVLGRRLHLGAGHDDFARELAQLRATTLSSNALKVEAKDDNRADAGALAVRLAVLLPPTDAGAGVLEKIVEHVHWGEGGLDVKAKWQRRFADGRVVATGPPQWSEDFLQHAVDRLIAGEPTPEIARWLEREGHPLGSFRSVYDVPKLRAFLEEQERLRMWTTVHHG